MKQCKTILVLLLTAFLLSGTVSVAAAADSTSAVTLRVRTDKQNYAVTDTATVTVRVKNVSGETLQDVVLYAEADHWLLASSREVNVLQVGDLQDGETRTLTFRCVLNRRAPGPCFFCRLTLFVQQLFRWPSAFKKMACTGTELAEDFVSVKHAGADVTVTAAAWCAPKQKENDSKSLSELATIDRIIQPAEDNFENRACSTKGETR